MFITQNLFISLIIGFGVGLSLGYFVVITSDPNYQQFAYRQSVKNFTNKRIVDKVGDYEDYVFDHEHEEEHSSIAQTLYDEIKILCYIIIEEDNHDRGLHIRATWGRRCNKLIFISTQSDEKIGAVGIPAKPGTEKILWARNQLALKYIYENYFDDYDWFLKADDDSYFVLENLRYMLKPHDANNPIYFGCKNQMSDETPYMNGGPGYVISKESLKLFYKTILSSDVLQYGICNLESTGYEDWELGKCFKQLKILPGDLRDSGSRTTFHPLQLQDHLLNNDNSKDWFFKNSYYLTGLGPDYSSDNAVAFHYVSPGWMYSYEFLIYHLRPYGIWSVPEELPKDKFTLEDEIKLLDEKEGERYKIINR